VPRAHNYRLVKIHRNYTVEEVATLFGAHRNTVRQWIKGGLPTIDRRRPVLILGRDLAEFLRVRRLSRKRPCQAGEMYCMRCRRPQAPAEGMVEYRPTTVLLGNLVGLCPSCCGVMYRRVNPAKLSGALGALIVSLPQGRRRIDESAPPTVNSDLGG
jgi:hypothetical protein